MTVFYRDPEAFDVPYEVDPLKSELYHYGICDGCQTRHLLVARLVPHGTISVDIPIVCGGCCDRAKSAEVVDLQE